MKILAIDDNQSILLLLKAQIDKLGSEYKLDTAESGKEGLKLAKESDYDLILMDLNMPQMSGIETGEEIRKHEQFHNNIFAFSAVDERLEESSLSIFDGIYNKPHDANRLLSDIKKMNQNLH